ncbi:hypothetical protein QBC46DRAFT_422242 [Diplogelasinospora grovesii]|uniref:GPI anchored serine-rich protein n=1 Tax=Diplogelasinospora grovesii TaxID=303347 RepID=A0AAN6NF91_9PEZI|nr:hypothetical protein QBC46DRAFT_422242 [Diplogelasinospora grovesii]
MRSAAITLLTLAAGAVANDNHWHPSSSEDCSESPTITLVPTWSATAPNQWTTNTVYTTSTHTITSCGPEVSHCPAQSTVVTTVVIPVSTTICPVTPTSIPSVAPPPSPPASPPSSWRAPPPPPAGSSSAWVAPSPPAVTSAVNTAPPTTPTITTSVGTIAPPSKTTSTLSPVTAGAAQNFQRAGGALAAVAAVAAAFI